MAEEVIKTKEEYSDEIELMKWVLYSFTTPVRVHKLSEKGRLKEISIIEEYEKFRQWALKQIES